MELISFRVEEGSGLEEVKPDGLELELSKWKLVLEQESLQDCHREKV